MVAELSLKDLKSFQMHPPFILNPDSIPVDFEFQFSVYTKSS